MALEVMRPEKRICDHCSLNNLDEALLIEILIRLPSSKTANRLKLVCRRWCSLISSDYFVRAFIHRRHDQSLPPIPRDDGDDEYSYSLVCQYFNRSCVIDCRSNGQFIAHRAIDFSFLPPRPVDWISVKATYEDLVLCCFYPDSKQTACSFYVCNPLTKQWVALPSPLSKDPGPRTLAVGFLCTPAPCSLCKQCVNNCRYKFVVVLIRGDYKIDDLVSELNVEIYSSDQGRWRSYMVSYPLGLFSRGASDLVAYRGVLHWVVSHRILVYDPYNAPERFSRIINLPPHPNDFNVFSVVVCQGRLRVVMGKLNPEAYIWELEDYETGKWSLELEGHGRRFCVYTHWNSYQIVNQWWPTPVPSLQLNMHDHKNRSLNLGASANLGYALPSTSASVLSHPQAVGAANSVLGATGGPSAHPSSAPPVPAAASTRGHGYPKCPACKFSNEKCPANYLFARYFTQSELSVYVEMVSLYQRKVILKNMENLDEAQRGRYIESIKTEVKARLKDPINGIYGVI